MWQWARAKTPVCGLAAVLALALVRPDMAFARDRVGQERARQAVESGQILPLRVILERVEKAVPGEVLEVELEQDDGLWLYELKVLQAGGVLTKLKLDARSGAILSARGKRAGTRAHERD